MTTRRSFFKRAAAVVAALALAPEIAFGRRLELAAVTDWKKVPFWIETSRVTTVRSASYLAWREAVLKANPEAIKNLFA